MQELKLYSEVQREASKKGDVYQYTEVPKSLRVQIFNITCEQIGNEYEYSASNSAAKIVYSFMVNTLCDRYGIHTLQDGPYTYHSNRRIFDELRNFLGKEESVERFLDCVQIIAYSIEQYTSNYRYKNQNGATERAIRAVEKINRRMQENDFGFRYANGMIQRVDSEYLHAETVLPALRLLNSTEFAGPQAEFLSAHEHFRKGKNKEAMNDALKAFESTMKVICIKHEWRFDGNKPEVSKATASYLINLCLENGLVPEYSKSMFTGLRTLLSDGVPTVRNQDSAHGQGPSVKEIPDRIAAYCLHMTAAGIVLLCESDAALV